MPYTLVPDDVSHDTVTALEQLLESARQGQTIGIIFGVMMKRRRFAVNCAGEARRDPSFARGMCCALDDELSTLVHQHAGPPTSF
ncbi:MAG TPA: hypothetical protein VNU71_13345 [Burkholderiaceae bacterium]|nr:hypothetical protein [Burkholderiaceae bacterium]